MDLPPCSTFEALAEALREATLTAETRLNEPQPQGNRKRKARHSVGHPLARVQPLWAGVHESPTG